MELNSEKKMCLKCTHLELVQHCTDLPVYVVLPAHREFRTSRARIWINIADQK